MTPSLVWIIIAAVAMGGELLSLALYLGSFSVAALIAALLAFLLPVPAQILAFLLIAFVLLFVARPLVMKVLPRGDEAGTVPRFGPSMQTGVAVEEVNRFGGEIRVGAGEFWSARVGDSSVMIPAGTEVHIVAMDGLTAMVEPSFSVPREAALEQYVPFEAPAPVLAAGHPFGLSARELEVLQLISAGMSNSEIAEKLVLSPRTVHHHVSHILSKMDAGSRTEAMSIAMQRGIIDLDESDAYEG